MDDALKYCLITATAVTGLLCGASLDQSIKQLPARHIIGLNSFSAYAKAADLRNGIIWYGALGVGSFVLTISTLIMMLRQYSASGVALPIYFATAFTLCHSICTAFAAPTYHKLKSIESDKALKPLFNRFERIQSFRSFFIASAFMSLLWAWVQSDGPSF
jgi:hypothetical protein